MIRKWFVRFFLLGLLFMGTATVAVGLLGYFATQQPKFYAELRAEEYSDLDQKMTNLFFRQKVHELEQWTARSIAQQRGQTSASTSASPFAFLASLQGEYDPQQDSRQIRITEKQINTQLASQKSTAQGDWRHPRLRFQQDRVDVAFEITTPEISFVFSASLQPTLTTEGRLRFDLLGAKIGQVPLPLTTVLAYLPNDVNFSNQEVEVNLTAASPHVLFKLPVTSAEVPTVSSLECTDGAISLELLPPMVNSPQVASR